jgi:hypothetical protein
MNQFGKKSDPIYVAKTLYVYIFWFDVGLSFIELDFVWPKSVVGLVFRWGML